MRGGRSFLLLMFVCVLDLVIFCLGTEKPSIVFKSSKKRFLNQSTVVLDCSVANQTDQRLNVTIERLLPGRPPQILQSKQSVSEVKVNYTKERLACEDMGEYRCRATMEGTHQPVYQNTDLNIPKCNPVPCPGEGYSKTVYAAMNETKTVYFCMQAFPNISTYANISKGSCDTMLMADIEDCQLEWSFDPLPDMFSYYNISVTVYNISQSNYTDLRLRLTTTQGTQYGAELTIKVKPFGSPECPTDLQLTYVERTHVLSWTPGMDGGSSQRFVVFYTSNGTWTQHQVTEGLTSRNITDLQDNVQYHVTVAAVNNFTNHPVYPTTCRNNSIPCTARRPPDCPTDLNMTSKERVHMLSWTPGSSGSTSQWFEVFYTSNNVTWTQRHVTSGQTSVNFTDLQKNTEYHVTVTSTNNHTSKIVNETSCQVNTISYRVHESPAATTSKLDVMEVALICMVVAVVVVVVMVIGMVIVKRGRPQASPSAQSSPMLKTPDKCDMRQTKKVCWHVPEETKIPPDTSDILMEDGSLKTPLQVKLPPCRYRNDEGLINLPIDHSSTNVVRNSKRRERVSYQKVENATSDFNRSGAVTEIYKKRGRPQASPSAQSRPMLKTPHKCDTRQNKKVRWHVLEGTEIPSETSDMLLEDGSLKSPFQVELPPCRYRNDEGLIYLTIDHSSTSNKRTRKRRKKLTHQKVEYATLDFKRSGASTQIFKDGGQQTFTQPELEYKSQVKRRQILKL